MFNWDQLGRDWREHLSVDMLTLRFTSAIIYYHLLAFIIIYYRLYTIVYYNLLSFTLIYYHLLSFTIIYYH